MSENESKSNKLYISITTATIIKVVLVGLVLWFLYIIRDILTIVFVSLVFAALIDPFASWFARHRIPRSLAVLIVYIIFFGALVLGVILVIPPLVTESRELGAQLGVLIERAGNGSRLFKFLPEEGALYNVQNLFSSFEGGISRAWTSVFNTITGFFGGIVSFFLILVLTFYLVVEEDALRRMLKAMLPLRYHANASILINKIQKKVGAWVKGQLLLGLLIGVITYAGLLLIGMPYALVLALLAGITELIPYVGPIFGAIPAVFLGLGQSLFTGLVVLLLYIGVQEFEKVFLVPKVMQKTLGLNPVVSIVVLVAGWKIGGVLGALLAFPVASALDVILKEYLERRI